jgi:hypothetical protein
MYAIIPDGQGFSRVEIDLEQLYKGIPGRDKFERQFEPFIQADDSAAKIINLTGNILQYKTEHIHVDGTDGRKSVLFVLGNPAVHSVVTGVPFAYEKKKNGDIKEHRFWKSLRDTGYVDLPYNLSTNEKKKKLFAADYNSEIIFNLEVFYTLPSTSSAQGNKNANHPILKNAGVPQLKSLFGTRALRRIASEESKRLHQIIQNYDAVIACQSDAYIGVKAPNSPKYSKKSLMERYFETQTIDGILLFCVPPTHLFGAAKVKEQLNDIRRRIAR